MEMAGFIPKACTVISWQQLIGKTETKQFSALLQRKLLLKTSQKRLEITIQMKIENLPAVLTLLKKTERKSEKEQQAPKRRTKESRQAQPFRSQTPSSLQTAKKASMLQIPTRSIKRNQAALQAEADTPIIFCTSFCLVYFSSTIDTITNLEKFTTTIDLQNRLISLLLPWLMPSSSSAISTQNISSQRGARFLT